MKALKATKHCYSYTVYIQLNLLLLLYVLLAHIASTSVRCGAVAID